MDRGSLSGRIEALRAECAVLGRELAEGGLGLSVDEVFGLAGEAQGLANAADALVGVAGALGARVETTLRESGSWERVHPVGFVDAMAASEMSLATGLTEGVAGRKVALGAALAERFPGVRSLLIEGSVAAANAQKVVDACAGLDVAACVAVDAAVAGRLVGMDPARVAAEARRVASRVAADQVAAHAALTRRGRCVEVRAGEGGLSDWFASLPTATSAAMWSAVESLAGEYRQVDGALSVPESRADALSDLLLRNVRVSARVTLGVPVVTDRAAVPVTPTTRHRVRDWGEQTGPGGIGVAAVEARDDVLGTVIDAVTGVVTRVAELDAASREALSWVEVPDVSASVGGFTHVTATVTDGLSVSGAQLPGVGWVDAATMANLLQAVPLEVARAVLDAGSGTLTSLTTAAYRPTTAVTDFVRTRDGTCRMWGCTRPVETCDLDHVRPWPAGATTPINLESLCRRHHRLKQTGRWRPHLDPDGTLTWHGPDGTTRVTEPAHRIPA